MSDFGEELIALVERHNTEPRGSRAMSMMTAISALMTAEKGSLLTLDEFSQCLLPLVGRLARAGLIATEKR